MLCSHLHLSSQEKRRKRRDKGMPERLWKLKRLDMQVGKFPCKLANIGSSLQGCLIKWLEKELWKRGAAHCTWEWHLEVVLCESIIETLPASKIPHNTVRHWHPCFLQQRPCNNRRCRRRCRQQKMCRRPVAGVGLLPLGTGVTRRSVTESGSWRWVFS